MMDKAKALEAVIWAANWYSITRQTGVLPSKNEMNLRGFTTREIDEAVLTLNGVKGTEDQTWESFCDEAYAAHNGHLNPLNRPADQRPAA